MEKAKKKVEEESNAKRDAAATKDKADEVIKKMKIADKEKEQKEAAKKAVEDKQKRQDKAGDGKIRPLFQDEAANPNHLKSSEPIFRLPGLSKTPSYR